jgi:NAD(P)-dependent dehydrogenase (short-subunit alcohol dehydrogenase family)
VVIADLCLRPEASELISQYPDHPAAVFQKTDVTSWPQLSACFDTAIRKFGNVDIVCAGAGVFEPPTSNFWSPPGSRESVDDSNGGRYLTLDINVTHPIRITQLALAHFLNPPGGKEKASLCNPKRVIITSSVAGQGYGLGTPLYFASKHAVNGFVWSMARLSELGIRVSAVAPGLVRTPLWLDHPDKAKVINEAKDVFCSPEEVAEAMLKLCIDESLDGGTVLEVVHKATRIVAPLMDPGPQGYGYTVSDSHVLPDEAMKALQRGGWGSKL